MAPGRYSFGTPSLPLSSGSDYNWKFQPSLASCSCELRRGRPLPLRNSRPALGGRSTVGHGALDAVIGVRIPASQPAFARLRRASARSARTARRRADESPPGEGCLDEARAAGEVGPHFSQQVRRRSTQRLRTSMPESKIPAGFFRSRWPERCLSAEPCVALELDSCTSSGAKAIRPVITSVVRQMSTTDSTGTTPVPLATPSNIDHGRSSCRWSSPRNELLRTSSVT